MFLIVTNKTGEQVVLTDVSGRYVKTIVTAGVHLRPPWQKVAARVNTGITEVRELLAIKTRDDIFINAPVRLHIQVTDVKKFVESATNPLSQVQARVGAVLRMELSQENLTDLPAQGGRICDKALADAGPAIESLYGVKIVDILLEELKAEHLPANLLPLMGVIGSAGMRAAQDLAVKEVIKDIARGLCEDLRVCKPIALKKRGHTP